MYNLKSHKTKKKSVRVGRGTSSGSGGHTVGRGMKGQKSRSGYKAPRKGFEGGSMPLSRRLPKLKGFTRGYFNHRINKLVFNLDDISNHFEDGETVNFDTLVEKSLVNSKSKNTVVKILADGELSKKITFDGIAMSKTAQEKITKSGSVVK